MRCIVSAAMARRLLEVQLETQLLHRAGDYAAALSAYTRLVGACGGAGNALDELLSDLAAASVLAGKPQRFLGAVVSNPSLAARARARARAHVPTTSCCSTPRRRCWRRAT
jgi:hypothetical protein